MSLDEKSLTKFESDGYVVVRDVLPKSQITAIRDAAEIIRHKSGESGGTIYDAKYPDAAFIKGDLCSFSELAPFDYLVFNKKITEIVKSLIGEQLVYFGESSTQNGLAIRGFHKDSRQSDREDASGLDWQGSYPIVRVGIYLHDCDVYSGGVKIVPGSHKIASSHFKRGGKNVDTRMGDIVIWRLTTTHSGNAQRLKVLKNLSLHPRFENFIPDSMGCVNPLRRIAMFAVYGAKGTHLDRYLDYFSARQDYQDYLRLAGTSKSLNDLANSVGVELCRSTEDYGADVNDLGFQF